MRANPQFSGSPSPNRFINHLAGLEGWEQRAIMGVTSLVSQPVIDYYNPYVDKKTRKYSAIKTLVKVIVGTCVGVSVRYALSRYFKNLILNKKCPRLMPLKPYIRDNKANREQYAKGLATAGGIVVSLFTNFLIDMPLTKWGINFLARKYKLNKESKPKAKKNV